MRGSRLFNAAAVIFGRLPRLRFLLDTQGTQTPITFGMWLRQEVLGVNRGPYWPVHPTSMVTGNWRNIKAGIETSPGYMPGCYVQAIGTIEIGDYTQIGPSVGIISANHVCEDSRQHLPSFVRIGAYCWIGMGAVILPDVELGDFTIVGAGAIVTRSAPEGYCVLAGNPATIVKRLDRSQCVRHRSKREYHGYIAAVDFPSFAKSNLKFDRDDGST